MHRYRKKSGATVIAVQLDLDTEGFNYHKWGGEQRCKPGDWLVDNQGDCYTIDGETFATTYTQVAAGVYGKTAEVWALVASDSGTVETREGSTAYEAGDYLVSNRPDGSDNYAVSKAVFEASYDLVES